MLLLKMLKEARLTERTHWKTQGIPRSTSVFSRVLLKRGFILNIQYSVILKHIDISSRRNEAKWCRRAAMMPRRYMMIVFFAMEAEGNEAF